MDNDFLKMKLISGNSKKINKVYFLSHHEDFESYFDLLFNDLKQTEIGIELYFDDNQAVDRDDVDIERIARNMQLAVIPVSRLFLTEPNRAKDKEVKILNKLGVPIFYIIMELGLETLCRNALGEIQYIERFNNESYSLKLINNLYHRLTDDISIEKIKKAFKANIFLSYRKKDGKHVKELMTLIHKIDFCRDIAIWYDNELVLGENYSEDIKNAIRECDLFVLNLTPHLLEEGNYVKEQEYPYAKELGKTIIAIETEETNIDHFIEAFPDVHKVINYKDFSSLTNVLREIFVSIDNSLSDEDPEHLYLIAKAYLGGVYVEIDNAKAAVLMQKAANKGNVSAQLESAISYDYNQNYKEAFKWYTKAANQGNIIAQGSLGYAYMNGEGVNQNTNKGLYWYKKAAKELMTAQYNLGSIYMEGEVVKKNYRKALWWFSKAAKQGELCAQYYKGVCYFVGGNGIKQNYKKAVENFTVASQGGHEKAQYHLGVCYAKGYGVNKDEAKSAFYYLQAARKGLPEAQYNLGYAYHHGKGIVQNTEMALFWYEKAKNQGDTDAQDQINSIRNTSNFLLDIGTPEEHELANKGDAESQFILGFKYDFNKKYEQSIYWYTKAAELGHPIAQHNLGVTYSSERRGTKNYEKAFYWLKKAAEQNDPNAQYLVGRFYMEETFVSQDFKQAIYWFQKAAEQRVVSAMIELGRCLSSYSRDYEQAIFWIKEAINLGRDDAIALLSWIYFEMQKWELAFFWSNESVRKEGDKASQFILGQLYAVGLGVAQDYDKALYWMKQSACQDNDLAKSWLENEAKLGKPDAQYVLADSLQILHVYDHALYWLKQSASNGYVKAQFDLGMLFSQGSIVDQNYNEAIYWIREALIKNYQPAIDWIEKEAMQGKSIAQEVFACYFFFQQEYDLAKYWYEQSALQGFAPAQYNLGLMYYKALGVECDFDQTIYWYINAAEQGYLDAQFNLGVFYFEGNIVPRNIKAAQYWLSKAAEQGDEEAQQYLKDYF